MRTLLSIAPQILTVLVLTMLALALAGLAGVVIERLRADRHMVREFRALLGKRLAQAWRMARRM